MAQPLLKGRDDLVRELTTLPLQSVLLLGVSGIGKRYLARSVALTHTHPSEIIQPEEPLTSAKTRALVSLFHTRPMSGTHKTLILDTDLVRYDLFSILLKLLEEPPSFARFYLIASQLNFPVTIRSRMAVYKVPPLSVPVIKEILVERGVQNTRASIMAARSGGSLEINDRDPQLLEEVEHFVNTLQKPLWSDILRLVFPWTDEHFETFVFDFLLNRERNADGRIASWDKVSKIIEMVSLRMSVQAKMVLAVSMILRPGA